MEEDHVINNSQCTTSLNETVDKNPGVRKLSRERSGTAESPSTERARLPSLPNQTAAGATELDQPALGRSMKRRKLACDSPQAEAEISTLSDKVCTLDAINYFFVCD